MKAIHYIGLYENFLTDFDERVGSNFSKPVTSQDHAHIREDRCVKCCARGRVAIN